MSTETQTSPEAESTQPEEPARGVPTRTEERPLEIDWSVLDKQGRTASAHAAELRAAAQEAEAAADRLADVALAAQEEESLGRHVLRGVAWGVGAFVTGCALNWLAEQVMAARERQQVPTLRRVDTEERPALRSVPAEGEQPA